MESAHPTRDLLTRFAWGEASREETRAVVRHLLTGCPRCLAGVRPTWMAAERLALRRALQPQLARRQKG
jgi:anti-sigma factor RsiW